jgi:HEAT repeat protein
LEPITSKPLEPIFRIIRESHDASAVRAAIMDLGYETRDEVYPVLVAKLNDPNPGIQHAAVISLGRFGRADAVQELIKPKIFRSPAANIRWVAVAAVGKLGDYRVIDYLLKAVDDPEWIVRTQAVTELMGKVQEIRDCRDHRQIHVLIHMLSLESEEIVGLAVEGLKEFGADSLTLLREALNNSSATIRMNAARALGKIASTQSAPCLLSALEDGDWRVRAGAAEALGAIGDPASIEPLIQKIHDNVAKVQEQASLALIRFGKQATTPLLHALSRERNKFVLRAILMALGKIADPRSISSLIGHLRSSYFIVRQAALTALGRFGPGVIDLLLPTLSYNSSDIGPLIRDAGDMDHPELQVRAVKAIGGLEDHRAVLTLKHLVNEASPEVQEAAIQALFQIGCAAWERCSAIKVLAEVGGPSLVSRLAPSLKDDSDNVRYEAVRSFGKWGGSDAVQFLTQVAVKDRAVFIRAEAIRALRTVGNGGQEVLETALRGLKDKGREVRVQAASLLGLSQNEKSILPLLNAMSDPHWSVRQRAENALLNFGFSAVQPLIGSLGSRHWTTRFRAARLLGELGNKEAVAPLKVLLARKTERDDVRKTAEAALAKLQVEAPS